MSLSRTIFTLAAPAALLALSACATPFKADVARFQQMPPPAGQSFTVQAVNPRNQGGLEFQQYAGIISQALVAQGYQPAANPRSATFVVNVDYGVDNGNEKVVSTPGFGGYGGPWGYGGFGGWGGYRRGGFGGWGWGWNDPFFYGPQVDSYTYYTSYLDMTINRTADGQRLFEGKAKARSRTNSLPTLVPNLVEALFTGFPGRNGEEVRITVAPPPRG
ncbi:DUF4136 domain-containing protein [Sphingomonas jatrophae]|uniref:DUF4136 domain-containing protein n=1 Tax=Sphingomonas jatrophae TaxID=1166337 RepID=A0A1I6K4S6_9SPHN|nr:DUF4136 domain-containing protein [Sphingomonas jatrophae]SFR86078.1 protein of unknown function [Sphingomonas jatrophae]